MILPLNIFFYIEDIDYISKYDYNSTNKSHKILNITININEENLI